ncbi:MAG: hypothetical protein OEZ39_07980 [Gammaproteobacteria bacterium]|nr:hypothetical protein [Gammaproteobacteria bacterium]MDH5651799.1 hypothetical protein [Gammaproteobacteria bacterium]
MTVSETFLRYLVSIAVFVTALSPVVLILLLIRDWKGKKLW